MFMTPEAITDLTDSPQRSRQIEWLDRHGWTYEVSLTGKPKVLLSYAERRMGLADAKKSANTEPDFSHWKTA
jgi:hypothetical protein